jgi:hypothetical protein
VRARCEIPGRLLGLVWVVALSCASLGRGCGIAAPDLELQEKSDIRGEQAVIIWDETHKIEHFIRQADIRTPSDNLGFLVPTPQTPELAEADPQIFDLAADVARPELVPNVIYLKPLEFMARLLWGPMITPFSTGSFNTMSGISERKDEEPDIVIHEQDVGDYHATILAADNAGAFKSWLTQNGYGWTRASQAWLQPYVDKKWKITAFRIKRKIGSAADGSLATRAIRMSFATDRPFFPYSEPSRTDERPSYETRNLSIALLSNVRMQGMLMEGATWPAEVRYAGSSDAAGPKWTRDQWLRFAKLDSSPSGPALPPFLTYFRDMSNPRVGSTDLVFSPSPNPSPYRKIETDYSETHHRFDLSDPLSNLLALIIGVLFLTCPIYCGWRVFSGRLETQKSGGIRTWRDRLFGCGSVAIGVVEGLLYGFSASIDFDPKQAPGGFWLGMPILFLIIAVLVLLDVCVLYCGFKVLRGKRTKRARILGAGSILFGLLAGLLLIGAFSSPLP